MNHEAIATARAYLCARGGDLSVFPELPFRKRSDHIERVCMWVDRLLVQGGVEDTAALELAAAFHDTGYVTAIEGHSLHSAEVLLAYAKEHTIPKATAERAAFLCAEHSNKDRWLPDPDAPRDLILLMEADLLDEEGAMGIVIDCMSAAVLGATSYLDAYTRMLDFEPRRLARNRMVTPLARQLWTEKQRIIDEFMHAFAYDLGIDDEA